MVGKEELKPILKTIIGASPKILPATLNKGDVVRYNNYLYQYKGENNQRISIIEENKFKKIGLRYRKSEYKVELVDTMENLYKSMFEVGVNGDNQGRQWNNSKQWVRRSDKISLFMLRSNLHENSIYYGLMKKNKYPNLFDRENETEKYKNGNYLSIYFEKYSSSSSINLKLKDLINILKKYTNTEDIKQILVLPINLPFATLTSENINNKLNINIPGSYLSRITLNSAVFNRELEREYDLIKSSINNKTSVNIESLNYFEGLTYYESEITNYSKHDQSRVSWYEAPFQFNDQKTQNTDYYITKLKNIDDLDFGVYQQMYDVGYKIECSKDNHNVNLKYEMYEYDVGSEGSSRIVYKHVINLVFDKKNNLKKINEVGFPYTDFWISYIPGIVRNDTGNITKRKMNEELKNNYGIYFKIPNPGIYKFNCKCVFSNKDQLNDGLTTKRYSYYLESNKVVSSSGNNVWLNNKGDIEITFTVNNDNTISHNFNISSNNQDNNNRLRVEFDNTGYKFLNGILYIKLFFGIWSYDDSGSWNEWQFAHIIPPFNLEYKGV